MPLVSLLAGLMLAAAPTPDWTPEACAAGAPAEAKCGRVEVLEDRERPEGRRLRLRVMILPSSGPARHPPMYDLAGGPGLPATASAVFYGGEGRAWREGRDVVLLDQRGTGGSGALRCPELEAASPFVRMYPPEAVRRCRETLSQGADLTRYGTREAAEDLDAVRRVLGHERIDIFAMSYGTMLAQSYMRSHPDRVRAAVLTGAVPLDERIPLHHAANAQRTLDLLLDDCGREAACAAAFPDLKGDWRRLLVRLDAGPVSIPTREGPVMAERGPVLERLRALMTTNFGQQRIPLIIHRAAAGDFSLLAPEGQGAPGGIAEGMYLSVVCAEGTLRITDDAARMAADGTFLRDYRVSEQRGACREWAPGTIGLEPMVFPPGPKVLFLAGGRDHVADPAWAEALSRRMPGSRVVRLEPMSHGIEGVEGIECFDSLAITFLSAGALSEDDLACVQTMRAPPFVTAP